MVDEISPPGPPICTLCSNLILDDFYTTESGQMLCPACGTARPRIPLSLVFRGFRFGLIGVALSVAVLWFMTTVLNFHSSFLVIFASLVVGTWVRKGSGKKGGRPFQILAVVLTYLSGLMIYVRLLDYLSPGSMLPLLWMPLRTLFEGGSFGIGTFVGFSVALAIAWGLNRPARSGRLGPFKQRPPAPPDFNAGV